MPFAHRIDEEENLLVTRVVGPVDAGELLAYFEALVQEERLRPGFRSYFDLSRAQPRNMDGDLVRQAADLARRHDDRHGHVRVAVLAPADVSFGLARMYSAMTDGLQREVRVFREAAEACAWLGISEPGDDLAA